MTKAFRRRFSLIIILFFYASVARSATPNAKIDSLKNSLLHAGEDTVTLKTLNNLSAEYRSENDYENSKKYAAQAIDLADKLSDKYASVRHDNIKPAENDFIIRCKKEKAKAIQNIGAIYYNQGNYEEALKSFFSTLKIMEEIGDTNRIADSYKNIGLVYQLLANYADALKYCSIALRMKEQTGDKMGIADCHSGIGNIYMYEGNYPDALKEHLVCLKIREEIGDKTGIEESYNNMGVVYTRQGNYDEALKNYFAALKISQEIGDKWDVALCYHNIGGVYQEQRNYKEALKNHLAALKLSEEIGDKSGMASAYSSIGSAYSKQGDFKEGLINLMASLKISEEIGEQRGAAEDCENIGEVYFDMGNYHEAINWLNKSLVKADSIAHKDLIKEIYSMLSKTYLKLNDYKKALEYHVLFSDMKDSLFNEAKSGQIAEMKTKYETEKKEKEIELLNKDKQLKETEILRQKNLRNGIIAGSGILIVASLIVFFFYKRRREAEMQLQIIDSRMKAINAQLDQHFIFSSLSSIRSYMLINIEQANDYLVRFAKFVRNVLKHSDMKAITLKQELEELENYMILEQFRFSKKFSYRINIAEGIDAEELLVPPLLFQPIVENSIKHGFDGISYEGIITVDIQREDHKLVCKLSDNGKGIQPKTNPAPDGRKSFGMLLTQERIDIFNKMHNQKAFFETGKLDQGTLVTLTLPITNE